MLKLIVILQILYPVICLLACMHKSMMPNTTLIHILNKKKQISKEKSFQKHNLKGINEKSGIHGGHLPPRRNSQQILQYRSNLLNVRNITTYKTNVSKFWYNCGNETLNWHTLKSIVLFDNQIKK